MNAVREVQWRPVLAAAAAAMAVAGLGVAVTNLGPWYYTLHKPAWQPPDWLFGPAWTLIFAFTALAGVLAWRSAGARPRKALILCLFALNAALNVFWSWLFFHLHRPDWALVEVGFFWFSILALVFALVRHTRAGSFLLVPYLLWVAFAAALNYAVVQLNAPFVGG